MRRALAALALVLASCQGPTLWIGEIGPAGETPTRPPTLPPEGPDASEAKPVENDADAQPPEATHPPRDDGPTAKAGPRDAGTMLPIDANDAGSTDPWDFDLPKPTRLPVVRGRCPELTGSGTYTFGDPRTRTLSVDIYIAPNARAKRGQGPPSMLILYLHAIGSNSREVVTGLGQLAIDAIVMMGGVVASFSAKLCPTCEAAEDVIWYAEDDAVIDQVVACALAQAHIDTRRIHAMGFSAGAMHSLHLAFVRSDYIASVISYSGGRLDLTAESAQDPSNRVPVLLSYGRVGIDYGIVDFPTLSLQWYEMAKAKGWYTMLCDHQGGHTIPADLAKQAIMFLLDHSYKFEPDMYAAGVPNIYPNYCANVPRER